MVIRLHGATIHQSASPAITDTLVSECSSRRIPTLLRTIAELVCVTALKRYLSYRWCAWEKMERIAAVVVSSQHATLDKILRSRAHDEIR